MSFIVLLYTTLYIMQLHIIRMVMYNIIYHVLQVAKHAHVCLYNVTYLIKVTMFTGLSIAVLLVAGLVDH